MNTALPTIPADTLNLFPASPVNHVMQFERLPNLSFVIQEVSLPGVSANPAKVMAPGLAINHPPDRLTYDALTVTFMVDEEFRAHREMHRWLNGVTGQEDRSVLVAQFLQEEQSYFWQEAKPINQFGRAASTNAGLTIVNGSKVPILRFFFHNVHPMSISEVRFATTVTDTITPLTCTATFAYDFYSIVDYPK